MTFQVASTTTRLPYGVMLFVANGYYGSIPYNGTGYMMFRPEVGHPDVVAVTLTNGGSFGLVSVDLADTLTPSDTPLPITFNGFKSDGSQVSTTFYTAGDGSQNFQTFTFGTDFRAGLTRVEVSQNWSMDNLVFDNVVVPEPRIAIWLVTALVFGTVWRIKRDGGG